MKRPNTFNQVATKSQELLESLRFRNVELNELIRNISSFVDGNTVSNVVCSECCEVSHRLVKSNEVLVTNETYREFIQVLSDVLLQVGCEGTRSSREKLAKQVVHEVSYFNSNHFQSDLPDSIDDPKACKESFAYLLFYFSDRWNLGRVIRIAHSFGLWCRSTSFDLYLNV